MKVVFRADASIKIGTGHIMRCVTLADELVRQGCECWFVCRKHRGNLGDFITSKGHKLAMLEASTNTSSSQENSPCDNYADWLEASWEEDARQTLHAISSLKPDWLVVDHYALDARWELIVSNSVGKIMVIDDLANRPHKCKLLLDQNLGRDSHDYDGLVPEGCRKLIGPDFALLRPEFLALREQSFKHRRVPEIRRILISMGGVDRANVTSEVLSILTASSLSDDVVLDVIMGGSSPFLSEVLHQASSLRFETSVSVNVKDMSERMCIADLSIGAVGSTSWERCCLGLPAILTVQAENQRGPAEALSESGAAIIADGSAGVGVELEKILTPDISDICLTKMTRAGRAMVDGAGCLRVCSELDLSGGDC